eukprot:TRINITY_DN963_c0_g1_i1.p1 TRINITY_DN963_c0_g1~~TRINITY_DN963_c0_g1_i1.p1  ORF type:complete len:209 (-),score=9.57 TRINITY_DN963_c0_g1_i1:86-712(-)
MTVLLFVCIFLGIVVAQPFLPPAIKFVNSPTDGKLVGTIIGYKGLLEEAQGHVALINTQPSGNSPGNTVALATDITWLPPDYLGLGEEWKWTEIWASVDWQENDFHRINFVLSGPEYCNVTSGLVVPHDWTNQDPDPHRWYSSWDLPTGGTVAPIYLQVYENNGQIVYWWAKFGFGQGQGELASVQMNITFATTNSEQPVISPLICQE